MRIKLARLRATLRRERDARGSCAVHQTNDD
jgi:hypothetical protein